MRSLCILATVFFVFSVVSICNCYDKMNINYQITLSDKNQSIYKCKRFLPESNQGYLCSNGNSIVPMVKFHKKDLKTVVALRN